MDFISQFAQIHLRQALILQFLNQRICVFPIDVEFQSLDMPLVVLHTLAKSSNVIHEHGSFGRTLGVHFLAFFGIALKLAFERFKLS